MAHPWNLDRALVALGAAIVILATAWAIVLDPATGIRSSPFGVGALLALAIVVYAPPWMYLVSGILTSAFPLLVIFGFGALGAIEHPGGGAESSSLILALMGALIALIGGIAGFVQTRRKTAPPAGAGMGATQGAFAGLIAALLLGLMLGNTFASADVLQFAQHPGSHVEGADLTRTLVAGGIAFAPDPLTMPAGKLVALDLRNDDHVFHTMSYRLNGSVHTTLIPVGSHQTLWFKFDAPQSIHFWCDPHSSETDTTPGGMHGDIVVT
jgi:plastocyanin